jgi:hypothetical protein
MFAQMPLFVYRHLTGAVSSDTMHSPTSRSRPQRAQFKTFAGNYGCNRRGHLGAWHAPGRRLEPKYEAVRCSRAGCVAVEAERQIALRFEVKISP